MFENKEIIEFINRIINSENITDEEIKTNVTKFYEYLSLTNMCDNETLKNISIIIDCLKEILKLKNKLGYIDINSLILRDGKNKVKQKTNRHFAHYETDSYSSSCGSSKTYSSHC